MATRYPAYSSMHILVEQIAASKYSKGVFGSRSMHTLLIAQTPEFDWDKEILRISLDIREGMFTFNFRETGSNLPKYRPWVRQCPPEEGFTRFEKFLRLKKWFVEYRPS
jgi:hypothetical protein